METKHTPGPWIADDFAQLIYSHGPSRGLSGDSEDCPPIVKYSDIISNQKANARLIAAAPELLAALMWVEKCRAAGALRNEDGQTPDFSLVHDAIAKATGAA